MSDAGESPRRCVLLTGAAGGIGRAFFDDARDRYRFRLADRVPIAAEVADGSGHGVVRFDIADLAACRRACERIDTVVHLAADANPAAGFYDSLLDSNIKGTYNVFRAAKDQGCRRVVFASSAWVMGGYPRDSQLPTEAPLRPVNLYGVSKCFGEALAAYFALAEGLSCIVVRIGAYDDGRAANWLRERPNVRELATYVSARDLHQILIRCIEVPDVPFAIAHGLSENRFKRLDLTYTRELLDYAPRDDAFVVFHDMLDDWLRE